jgi:chemosensory pili system protein ChpA (sensor histidine kinase/response regulator)
MSARLNLTLLRTLKPSMVEILGTVDRELGALLEGHSPPSPWPAVAQVRTIENGLGLVGSRGLARLVALLAEALETVSEQVARKGDVMLIQNIVRASRQMIHAVSEHFEGLARGEDLESVLLWPWLDSLCRAMSRPTPVPEQLFEPGAPILPEKPGRKRASKADVRREATSARTRMQEDIDVLATATERPVIETHLRNIQKTLEGLGGLRPQSEFQAYWVALRGSAAVAQMDIPAFLAHRDVWMTRFGHAVDIIESFGADGLHVNEDHLYDALAPLLEPHPHTWSMLNPVIHETEDLFSLGSFREAATEARDTEFQRVLEQFRDQRPMLREVIGGLHQVWDKVVAGKTGKPQFVQQAVILMANRSLFPGATISPLFDSLQVVLDRFNAKPQEPIDPQLSEELAASILIFADAIEQGGRWGDDVEAQIRLQKSRLDLALARRFAELVVLPRVRATRRVTEERSRAAEKVVITEVRRDLGYIRTQLEGLWENDPEALAEYPRLPERLEGMEGALAMLGQTAASHVVSLMRPHLRSMETEQQRRDMPRRQALLDQVGALMAFLGSWELGDNDAALLLAPVLGEGSAEIAADRAARTGAVAVTPALLEGLGDPAQESGSAESIPVGSEEKESGPAPVIDSPAFEEPVFEETEEDSDDAIEVPLPVLPPLGHDDLGDDGVAEPEMAAPPAVEPPAIELAAVEPETETLGSEESGEAVAAAPSKGSALHPADVVRDETWDRADEQEIAAAFLEEAIEILATIESESAVLADLGDMTLPRASEALVTVRRGFHTLKGSGQLSGFHRFGTAAKAQEEALDERIDAPGFWDEEQQAWVDAVVRQMRQWWASLNAAGEAKIDFALLPAIPVWHPAPLVAEEDRVEARAEETRAEEGRAEEEEDSLVPGGSGLASVADAFDESEFDDAEFEAIFATPPEAAPESTIGAAEPSAPVMAGEMQAVVADEMTEYSQALAAFGEGNGDVMAAFRAAHNVVAIGREHFSDAAWLPLAVAIHDAWGLAGEPADVPVLIEEACLVLAVDLRRGIAHHATPTRQHLIRQLGSAPAEGGANPDWSAAFEALQGMGDNFQRLVEAFSAQAPTNDA